MAKIAFLLLCHKDPDAIIQQAERLTATGDCISIHFDARARQADFDRVRRALQGNSRAVLAPRRVRCGWGEWSLVAASLSALETALESFPDASHFYMLSGDCMPVKSSAYAHALLDEREVDFIESFDFFTSDWIKTGLKEERLVYRHFFNERRHKALFYSSYQLQQRLGLRRKVPRDLQIMIGSQWWCLRRSTCEAMLDFLNQRPDVIRFFRRTWIPDETFFQTLVRHLVPGEEIDPRTLTFLIFSDYGMPVTFFNDHYDLLLTQDALFARKISPDATELKARLGELWASGRSDFPISDEGRQLHRFLTGRGRIGRRFAPRFWERDSTLGRERELLILCCKKWHVAKRLLGRIRKGAGIPGVAYLFDEPQTDLPDLGGIENRLDKRLRHRRALMRMLFDYYGTERLIICVDPRNLEMIQDFFADRSLTSLLEIECEFSDEYLLGHARRLGLASEASPEPMVRRLLPTIRHDLALESEQIRDGNFPRLHCMSERMEEVQNVATLAAFLGIERERARAILATEDLFTD